MPANRIFCIGKNYAEHVAELAHLGHSPDGDCVVFMKPASCLVEEGQPIVLPRDRGAVHHEAELVIELTGGGRDIPEDEALDCVAGMTLGLDLTLRDLQTALKSNGKPWELAKAFDGSASALVLRALGTEKTSKKELSAIRAMLDELEKGGRS